MKEYSYDLILEKLISKIKIKESNPIIGITFIAGPGFGKPTVSKILSKKLGIDVMANDKIRRLYDELGFNNEEYEPDIKKMAYDRTVYLLQNKTSHIVDANIEFHWEMAIDNYEKYNAKLLFIELTCSEEEILRRIEKRKKTFGQTDNYSRATEIDYYKYLELKKQKQIPREKIFYTINTEKDIEKQIDSLIEKIKKELK